MNKENKEFSAFIAEEVKKNQGLYVPVKAGLFERWFVRKANSSRLHPNPDDEFCDPSIGPNYEIISNYVKTILRYKSLDADEPLVVEKVHPDGYLILNGHHRWAAALRTGYNPLPISIVNLTQETDIEQMIRNSSHDKRVTIDLDEVVFCNEDEPAEPPLPFPFSTAYKERIRLGIPALLHFLSKQGYDIWILTAKYYSIDYLRRYMKRYSVKVDGIVTGLGRKSRSMEEAKPRVEKLLTNHYTETLHIDKKMILHTGRDISYEVIPIDAEGDEWAYTVITAVKEMGLGEKSS